MSSSPVKRTESGRIAPRKKTAGGDVSRETSNPSPAGRPIVLAVINQKGGVGKTTTAVSLAADLTQRGYRTLLLDLDPQGNATTALGVDLYTDRAASAYDLLFGDGPAPPALPGDAQRPDLYPGQIGLIRADIDLLALGDERDRQLQRRLAQLPKDTYDFLVIDSPPSLGILTLNILIASHGVIVPVQCEYLALEGLSMLLDTLEEIRSTHHPALRILGTVITMTDLRTNLSQQVITDVRQHLGDLVFDSMIPRTIRLSECPSHGKTIFQYDRWGAGARAYESLAGEVVARLGLPARQTTK